MYTITKSNGQLEWGTDTLSLLYKKTYTIRALFKDVNKDNTIGQIYVDMGSEEKPECTIIAGYATGDTPKILKTPNGKKNKHYIKLGKLIQSIRDTAQKNGLMIYNIKLVDEQHRVVKEWDYNVC